MPKRSGMLVGLLLGLTWFVAWVGLVTENGFSYQSFRQSSEDINSCALLLWPLALAVGCATTVAMSKKGVLQYLQSWRYDSTASFIAAKIVRIWAFSLPGPILAVVVAVILASRYNSPATPSFLYGFGIATSGLLACLVVGAVVGVVLPSYLVAILLMVIQYVGSWKLGAIGHDPMAFVGVTAGYGEVFTMVPLTAFLYILAVLLVIIFSKQVMSLILMQKSKREKNYLTKFIAITMSFYVLLALAIAIDHQKKNGQIMRRNSGDNWICKDVGITGSTACIAKDIQSFAPAFFTDIQSVDGLVSTVVAKIVKDKPRIVYAPALIAVGETKESDFLIAIEMDFKDGRKRWMQSISSTFIAHPEWFPAVDKKSTEEDCFWGPQKILEILEQQRDGREVQSDVLWNALVTQASCRQ